MKHFIMSGAWRYFSTPFLHYGLGSTRHRFSKGHIITLEDVEPKKHFEVTTGFGDKILYRGPDRAKAELAIIMFEREAKTAKKAYIIENRLPVLEEDTFKVVETAGSNIIMIRPSDGEQNFASNDCLLFAGCEGLKSTLNRRESRAKKIIKIYDISNLPDQHSEEVVAVLGVGDCLVFNIKGVYGDTQSRLIWDGNNVDSK